MGFVALGYGGALYEEVCPGVLSALGFFYAPYAEVVWVSGSSGRRWCVVSACGTSCFLVLILVWSSALGGPGLAACGQCLALCFD